MFYNPLPLLVRLVLSNCPTINQWEPLQAGSSELEHISHFQGQLPGRVIPTITQTLLLENPCMVQCAAVAELTFFVIFQQGALHSRFSLVHPLVFEHCLAFWHENIFQIHCTIPVPDLEFRGKWYLETKI